MMPEDIIAQAEWGPGAAASGSLGVGGVQAEGPGMQQEGRGQMAIVPVHPLS